MIFPNPITFFKAALIGFWYGIRGYRTLTTTAEGLDRLCHCGPCPYRVNEQCGKCSCWLVAKTALASEKCPVGKWPRIKQKRALTPKVKA